MSSLNMAQIRRRMRKLGAAASVQNGDAVPPAPMPPVTTPPAGTPPTQDMSQLNPQMRTMVNLALTYGFVPQMVSGPDEISLTYAGNGDVVLRLVGSAAPFTAYVTRGHGGDNDADKEVTIDSPKDVADLLKSMMDEGLVAAPGNMDTGPAAAVNPVAPLKPLTPVAASKQGSKAMPFNHLTVAQKLELLQTRAAKKKGNAANFGGKKAPPFTKKDGGAKGKPRAPSGSKTGGFGKNDMTSAEYTAEVKRLLGTLDYKVRINSKMQQEIDNFHDEGAHPGRAVRAIIRGGSKA